MFESWQFTEERKNTKTDVYNKKQAQMCAEGCEGGHL